jgi:hypothetical protein
VQELVLRRKLPHSHAELQTNQLNDSVSRSRSSQQVRGAKADKREAARDMSFRLLKRL